MSGRDTYKPNPESVERWTIAFNLYRRGYTQKRIAEALLCAPGSAREFIFKYTRIVLLKLPYKCAKCDGSGWDSHSVPCMEFHVRLARQGGESPSPCPPFSVRAGAPSAAPQFRCPECRRDMPASDENEHTKGHVFELLTEGLAYREVAGRLGIMHTRVGAYARRAPGPVRVLWAALHQRKRSLERQRGSVRVSALAPLAPPDKMPPARRPPPPPKPTATPPPSPPGPRVKPPTRPVRCGVFEVVTSSEPRPLSSVAWDIAVRNVQGQ